MITGSGFFSPFYKLSRLSHLWNIDLWIKRDDLIPNYLGGNKVRKTSAILKSAFAEGRVPDVIVTNGGAESNHARVVALMGTQLGCEVTLVLHGQAPPGNNFNSNSFFYRSAGARVSYVDSYEIADTVQDIICRVKDSGRRVLVIPGGGHSIEGASAYADAVDELPFFPDFIIHASGTGGTQAGILTGLRKRNNSHTRLIGISVARETGRGCEEIAKLLPDCVSSDEICLKDEFRFGGYGKFTAELMEFIREVVRVEGLPLDPTYTGKAMYGLHQLVAQGDIPNGSKVVFWHTGGLLNLTAITGDE